MGKQIKNFFGNLWFYLTNYKQIKQKEDQIKKENLMYENQAQRLMKHFEKQEEQFPGDNSQEW